MTEPLFDFAEGVKPDVAPKETGGRKQRADKGKPRGRRGGASRTVIASGMEEIHTAIGIALSVVNQADGELIVSNAARAGELWANAAQKNDQVRKALEKFLAASTFAEIVAFYVTIGVKIAVNHEILPERFAPIFSKDAPEMNGNGGGVSVGMPDLSGVPLEVLQEMFPQFNITPTQAEGYVP